MSSFFSHFSVFWRYFYIIHSPSTFFPHPNPHKITRLSTYVSFRNKPQIPFCSHRTPSDHVKKQADSLTFSLNHMHLISEKCTSSACQDNFFSCFTALIIVLQLQTVKPFCPTVFDNIFLFSAVINCCYQRIDGRTDNIRVNTSTPCKSSVWFTDSDISNSL